MHNRSDACCGHDHMHRSYVHTAACNVTQTSGALRHVLATVADQLSILSHRFIAPALPALTVTRYIIPVHIQLYCTIWELVDLILEAAMHIDFVYGKLESILQLPACHVTPKEHLHVRLHWLPGSHFSVGLLT